MARSSISRARPSRSRQPNSWTSPHTGATYPSGWLVTVPGEQLEIQLTPSVLDQELDTRATTGVVYWEGSQLVEATRAGEPVDGEAYVELTGLPVYELTRYSATSSCADHHDRDHAQVERHVRAVRARAQSVAACSSYE